MACISSSIDLLYLIKTSWCRCIIFIKENLILLIWPFCFNYIYIIIKQRQAQKNKINSFLKRQVFSLRALKGGGSREFQQALCGKIFAMLTPFINTWEDETGKIYLNSKPDPVLRTLQSYHWKMLIGVFQSHCTAWLMSRCYPVSCYRMTCWL